MNKITYQEIDIRLNVIFSQAQVKPTTAQLDAEIKQALTVGFDESFQTEPMVVTEIESAIQNVHLRITTSVDCTKDELEISRYIMNKVKEMLPMGVVKIELLSIREEAEIYGNA